MYASQYIFSGSIITSDGVKFQIPYVSNWFSVFTFSFSKAIYFCQFNFLLLCVMPHRL